MSKYIDAEWLENNAKEYSLGYYEDDEWATPLNILDSAPSIDIVRCGECKWYDGKGHCKLRYGSLGVFEDVSCDDFCSYGERKESE